MRLDIRYPIGLLFGMLGIILTLFGALGPKDVYANSLGYNVNLIWGIVLLLFGGFMLLMARRGTASARLADEEPEGRAMEEVDRIRGHEPGPPKH